MDLSDYDPGRVHDELIGTYSTEDDQREFARRVLTDALPRSLRDKLNEAGLWR